MSPAKTSASCSVTASGRPAARRPRKATSGSRRRPSASRVSGAGAEVAERLAVARDVSRLPVAVTKRSSRSCGPPSVDTRSDWPGRSWYSGRAAGSAVRNASASRVVDVETSEHAADRVAVLDAVLAPVIGGAVVRRRDRPATEARDDDRRAGGGEHIPGQAERRDGGQREDDEGDPLAGRERARGRGPGRRLALKFVLCSRPWSGDPGKAASLPHPLRPRVRGARAPWPSTSTTTSPCSSAAPTSCSSRASSSPSSRAASRCGSRRASTRPGPTCTSATPSSSTSCASCRTSATTSSS